MENFRLPLSALPSNCLSATMASSKGMCLQPNVSQEGQSCVEETKWWIRWEETYERNFFRAWTFRECRASTDESRMAGECAPSEMAIDSEKPFLPSSDDVRS